MENNWLEGRISNDTSPVDLAQDIPTYSEEQVRDIQTSFMNKTYTWMGVGILLTGLLASYLGTNEAFLQLVFSNRLGFIAIMLLQLGITFFITSRISTMSYSTSVASFIAYTVLTGIFFSPICFIYSSDSLLTTFGVTAGTFFAMSVIGYTTKYDMSGMRGLFFGAIIGVFIALLVNMFLQSELFDYIISFIGVFLFMGLTAYDTQKLKAMAVEVNHEEGNIKNNAPILGAFTLYLDFINLFLFLLRFFGNRK
ncbi:MAG: Bax inhibitor-1/YccA family protein [Bacteroidota bacterium]|nr:Bax inhibitor-1/YccA family protein [Bacteroidota bacterium]